jgi:hypothetical protein
MKPARAQRRRIPRRATALTARQRRRATPPTQQRTSNVRSGTAGSITPGFNASLKRDLERRCLMASHFQAWPKPASHIRSSRPSGAHRFALIHLSVCPSEKIIGCLRSLVAWTRYGLRLIFCFALCFLFHFASGFIISICFGRV